MFFPSTEGYEADEAGREVRLHKKEDCWKNKSFLPAHRGGGSSAGINNWSQVDNHRWSTVVWTWGGHWGGRCCCRLANEPNRVLKSIIHAP